MAGSSGSGSLPHNFHQGRGGGSLLPVSRQNTSGVASGDTHQCGSLVQCHVLSQQTVQNLKSCLFFLSQSHILHDVNLTFLLASQRGHFR